MTARARRRRLPTVLFWIGAMLAPLAAIGLWFARDGGELRGTAAVAILGTVLIGLSVVLRRDVEGVRIELQENLLAESAAIRSDLGSAMTTALQRTKHGTHAELAALQEQLDALTARLAEPVPSGARRPTLPHRRDPVRDSMRPGTIDPVRDSMRPGAIDPVRDSLRPGMVEPVRDDTGERRLPRAGAELRLRGAPADHRTPTADPGNPPAPAAPRPIDPLRDSVARLDPWSALRGEDPPKRRARHRAED